MVMRRIGGPFVSIIRYVYRPKLSLPFFRILSVIGDFAISPVLPGLNVVVDSVSLVDHTVVVEGSACIADVCSECLILYWLVLMLVSETPWISISIRSMS